VTFKKGNKGRPVGALNKLPAEAKDVLARAYTELGGFTHRKGLGQQRGSTRRP
jgi:hypothetical protein